MPQRIGSENGKCEIEKTLGQRPEGIGTPAVQSSAGGNLQRKIGTRGEKKTLDEALVGQTRPLGAINARAGARRRCNDQTNQRNLGCDRGW